ncbi:alpha/beta-hydrolase [Eremomyces bilateralis CBS 781.70]|uniref:Alpha/beta-hydrolase n=1 Tax=Eremomyces bilateralis CBS 781.70 TaxID=1392243 RepID=A0A6G1GFV2_9PEZI|nr:alpha/beta-hydrolase [Eremomyces bilateralis CBS 781.70]KAF1816933.1 alpha/beta-hydrolase [Eremomyces bilateralis CBS 781.70]
MSSKYFQVQVHSVPCQHIRGYPHAAIKDDEICHLHVKQYTPLDNLKPQPGDLTIIGAHANGFPKELYEPLWDELLKRAKAANIRIRNIWAADVSQQGYSGVLNEGKLGDDPSWFDHSRDLLGMVNHFRKEMPRPMMGIGHSMGGCQLTNLALLHPRLFESLILIDPVIQAYSSSSGNYQPANASAGRRDRWPSRAVAAASVKKSKFYGTWDPRVRNLWIEHGFRELPTVLYEETPTAERTLKHVAPTTVEPTLTPPPLPEKEVTLTTTKHHEVFTFLRPNFGPNTPQVHGSYTKIEKADPSWNRLTHPDITPTGMPQTPFYRPEPIITYHNLPHLRPSVFYVFGDESALSAPEFRDQKLSITGVGVGGSGGVAEGRVDHVILKDTGHLIPMEKVGETADRAMGWIGKEVARYRVIEEASRREWDRLSDGEKRTMSARYLDKMMGLVKRKPKL